MRRRRKKRVSERNFLSNPNPSFTHVNRCQSPCPYPQSLLTSSDPNFNQPNSQAYEHKKPFQVVYTSLFFNTDKGSSLRSFRQNQSNSNTERGGEAYGNGGREHSTVKRHHDRDQGPRKPRFRRCHFDVPSLCPSLVSANAITYQFFLYSIKAITLGKNPSDNLKGRRESVIKPRGGLAYGDGLPCSQTEPFDASQIKFVSLADAYLKNSGMMITLMPIISIIMDDCWQLCKPNIEHKGFTPFVGLPFYYYLVLSLFSPSPCDTNYWYSMDPPSFKVSLRQNHFYVNRSYSFKSSDHREPPAILMLERIAQVQVISLQEQLSSENFSLVNLEAFFYWRYSSLKYG